MQKTHPNIHLNLFYCIIQGFSKQRSEEVVFFAFLFYLVFLLSLTLIIGILYCLYYTSLLLHLITAHFASHLSRSSTIFIISTLIISIFYYINYTSLLLHLIITHLVYIFYNNYLINICPRQLLYDLYKYH